MPTLDAPDLDAAVVALAARIAALDPGPLAELRRAAAPEGTATFWRLRHPLRLPYTNAAWETLMQAIAILTPTGQPEGRHSAHDGRHPLGSAFFEAGVSDLRFSRLLAAPLEERRRALLRLVRLLAQQELRCDLRPLARMILFDAVEPDKRRLARDYYAAEAANKAKETAADA